MIPVPEKEFEYDFYIIYSRTDAAEWVQRNLLPTLEMDLGLRCCVDWRHFPPGRSITDNIKDFVLKSRKTIVVVSNGFFQSCHPVDELEVAVSVSRQRGDKSLIVIKIDDVEMNRLPKACYGENIIDLTTSQKMLKEELSPFLEVRAKQGVKQGAYIHYELVRVSEQEYPFPPTPRFSLTVNNLKKNVSLCLPMLETACFKYCGTPIGSLKLR